MRIISGKHRGRVLAEFRGKEIRPTADRVKESLFNILAARIPGARVLDLFCGSGALGLECISRGAEAVFNDVSADSLAVLKKNLTAMKESAAVYGYDYKVCLDRMTGKFDLIFVDPPYACDYLADVLNRIAERDLLEEDGLVIYESDRPADGLPQGWVTADERNYGRTSVWFFRRQV